MTAVKKDEHDAQSTEKNSPHMCPSSAASLTAHVAQHIDSQMQHTLAWSFDNS